LTFLPPVILAIILQEIPKGKLLFRIIFYLPAVLSGLVTLLLWKQFYQPSESGMLNAVLLHVPAAVFLLAGAGLFVLCGLFAWRLSLHGMWLPVVGFLITAIALFSVCFSLARPMLILPDESFWTALSHVGPRLFRTMPEPIRWLSDPAWAMLACILPALWAGMGPGCLIYLAALRGIPEDFYEAAEIDGAGILDKVLFVVFPMLKTLLIINFVGAFIHAWFGSADSILAMTGGGANTEVADLHLFYKAFVFLEFGPATAMAWILGFLLIGFTVYQLRILARVEFRTTGGK
jgi:multiple sugar transport system permease protein